MMLHLLPMPKEIRMDEGSFSLTMDTCIAGPRVPADMMRTATAQLRAEIESACGVRLTVLSQTAREGDIGLAIDPELAEEAYTLRIDAAGVMLVGGSAAGLMHGVQTLRQIIRQCGWTLPALTIEDAPVYKARGFYHDVTRGRVPTLGWLMQLADE